ncbi:hypothetical protein JTB14_005865 [Gonioctena quinquepunctata]|nr:hypothetical protein JTB14_005865 [Gonioctena quinquepunctata]
MSTVAEIVAETREDIPLKRGRKSTKWYACNEEFFSGPKYISAAFSTLTFVITLALLIQIYYGDYQVVPHGSVATDSLELATPHVTGLDAEGHLLIYNHKTRLAPNVIDFGSSEVVADHLPKLVLGLAHTHQLYGSLSWKELVEPAAQLARQGYVVSPMLVKAIASSHAEDLYGRLEPGQLLQHEHLAESLDKIARLSENELYGFPNDENKPNNLEADQILFSNHHIYVPQGTTIGPLVGHTLGEIQNSTKRKSNKSEYIYNLAEISRNIQSLPGVKFHEGTFSNVAVIDKDDNYVSLVTGMYGFFGSGEMTSHGYVLDVKNKTESCSRVAMIITDANLICGRRMVLGANDLPSAIQMISSLLTANENITESIEAPRFHVLNGEAIAIEGAHFPSFTNETMEYLKMLTPIPVAVPEPYESINIVEKIKDDLSSHSDSRGGGIAVRF